MLKTMYRISCNTNLTKTIKQLFRSELLWCLEIGRTRQVRGYIQRVEVLALQFRQQAKLATILLRHVRPGRAFRSTHTLLFIDITTGVAPIAARIYSNKRRPQLSTAHGLEKLIQ